MFTCLAFLTMMTSCQNRSYLSEPYGLEDNKLELSGQELKLGEKTASIYPFQGNENVIDVFNQRTSTLRSSYNSELLFEHGVNIQEEDYNFYFFPAEKDGRRLIVGGYGFQGIDGIDRIFYFEQKQEDSNIYTLMDESENPIVDVSIDTSSGECRYVKVYDENALRASKSEWCGVGMAVVGTVAASFVPMTLGASIGFAACWGVVSGLMCR